MTDVQTAIDRIEANDARLERIANQLGGYTTSSGSQRETWPDLSARLDNELGSFIDVGAWVTPKNYVKRNVTTSGGVAYAATQDHAAGATFAADLAAGKWRIYQGNTATQVAYNGDSAKGQFDNSQRSLRLNRFKTAISKMAIAGTGSASWLVFGDSVAISLIPNQFFFEMFRRYGLRGMWFNANSGLGFPLYSTFNLQGGTPSGATNTGADYLSSPHGGAFSQTAAGHRVTFGPTTATSYGGVKPKFNKATFVYRKKAGGGTFKLQRISPTDTGEMPQDVAGSTAVSTDDAGGGFGTIVVNFPYTGAWRLSSLWVSGDVTVVGCFMEDTAAKGIVYANLATGGLDMVNSNLIPQANLAVILGLIKPDICSWAMKDANVTTALQAHQVLWDGAYATEWLYLTPYPDVSVVNESIIRAAAQPIIDHALARGFDYYDTIIDCPTYAYGTSQSWFLDATHYNQNAQGTLSAKLIRSMGVLPGFAVGLITDITAEKNSARSMEVLDQLSVNGFDVEKRTRQLRGQGIAAGRGVMCAGGQFGGMYATKSAAPIGASSFTMMCWVRVPAVITYTEFVGMYQVLFGSPIGNVGLSINTGQGSVVLAFTPDGGGAGYTFISVAALTYLQNLVGEVVQIAVRRDITAAAGESVVDVFINNVRFPLSGQTANNPFASVSNDHFRLGSFSQAMGASSWEFYGGARYLSALTEAQLEECWVRGEPATPGSDIFWRLDEQIGVAFGHPSGVRGTFQGVGCSWRIPAAPREPTQAVEIFGKTLVPGETVVNNWTANGNRVPWALPATPSVGTEVEVTGANGTWRITQPAGHQIVEGAGATVGVNASTIGATGYIQSANVYDSVRLRCVIADLVTPNVKWVVVFKTGAPTFA